MELLTGEDRPDLVCVAIRVGVQDGMQIMEIGGAAVGGQLGLESAAPPAIGPAQHQTGSKQEYASPQSHAHRRFIAPVPPTILRQAVPGSPRGYRRSAPCDGQEV
jgi:hypothetical protein